MDTEGKPEKYCFLDFKDGGKALKLKIQIYSGAIRMVVKADMY